MTRPIRHLVLFVGLAAFGLVCACGGGEFTPAVDDESLPAGTVPEQDAGGALPVPSTPGGRLAFAGAQDARHVFVLDSRFDPTAVWGLPLDPPWIPGKNQLTVLRVEGETLSVEGAVPLGDDNVACTFQLSPDGDTALVGVWEFERGPRLLVVRGLRDGTGHVAQNLPAPDELTTFAFSPDGRKALIGHIVPAGKTLELQLLAGLPDDAHYEGTIDTGVFVDFQANVDSLDVSPDGTVAAAKNIFCKDRSHQPGSSRAAVQAISHPFDLDAVSVSEPFWPSAISVYPPPPPYEGTESGFPMGDIALVGDGDTAVLPMTGYVGTEVSIPLADARILLIQGFRSGQPHLVRTLGPEDGVDPFPIQLALAPGRDSLVVSNFGWETVTVMRGLSDPTLSDVRLESFPAGRIAWEPAITPDGRTLLLSNPRAPVDDGLPAEVSAHALSGGQVGPAFGSVREDVHTTYVWLDSNFQAWPPGLVDHVRAITGDLPSEVGEALVRCIEDAVAAADGGKVGEARAGLRGCVEELERLRQQGALSPSAADVLAQLLDVADEHLARGTGDPTVRVRASPRLHVR